MLIKIWNVSVRVRGQTVRVRVMDSPASDLSATSLEPVCDQDSVTEFGLYGTVQENLGRLAAPW